MSDMVATTFPGYLYSTSDGPRIYISGGCVSNQVCVSDNCFCTELTNKTIYFTPETSTYHTNVADMPRQRYRHMAARVEQYLYLFGGRDLSDKLVKEIDRYDTVTNTWSTLPETWVNATSDGVAFSQNQGHLIYVVSGYFQNYTNSNELHVFNTTSGTFFPYLSYPSMPTLRGDTQGAVLFDNDFYVIGGWNSSAGFCTPVTGMSPRSYNICVICV